MRVEDADRDVARDGGQNRRRVQHLCPEVSQLGGFIKRELGNGIGVLYDPGIVVVHAVYVGPDLDLLGIDGSAYQGGRVITAPAFEVVDLAEDVAADVTLGDE